MSEQASLLYLIDQAGDPGKMVSPDLLVMVGETNNMFLRRAPLLWEGGIHVLKGRLKGNVLWVEAPLRFDDESKNMFC